jgi:hypothetical protein
MSEIKKIITEIGVSEKGAKEILSYLSSYEEKRKEWQKRKEIVVTSIDQEDEMEAARVARIATMKDRTGAEKFIDSKRKEVQEEMSEYTKKDKALLKLKQFYEAEAKEVEASLKIAEEFKANWEKEQKEILVAERTEKLSAVYDNPGDYPLDSMTDKSFEDLLESLTAMKEKREREELLQTERYEKVKAVLTFFDDSVLDTLGKLTEEDFNKKLSVATKAKKDGEAAKVKAQKEKEENFIKRIDELKLYHSKFSSMVGMHTTEEAYQNILEKAKAYVEPAPKVSEPAPSQDWGNTPITTPAVKVVSKPNKETPVKVDTKEVLKEWVNAFRFPAIDTDGVSKEGLAVGRDIQSKFVSFKKWAQKEIDKL